jgi:uncharacterized protein (DUF1501 family)
MSISRRRFISVVCRSIASVGAFGAFSRFGALNAFAQAPDYKALVCVFLFGGNDGNNMVIPFDTAGYQNYQALRGLNNGVAGVALDQSVLLPIQPASTPGLPFALHPRLAEVQALFNSKKAAIVANVGNLVFPTTRSQYINHQIQVPANLFSHSDQQNQLQTAAADSKSPTGWAGRVADAVQSMNTGAQYPAVVSLAGAPIFCNGNQTSPASVSPGNLSGVTCSEGSSICSARSQAAQQLLTFDTGISLVQAASQVTTNANKYTKLLSDAVSSSPALLTQFPNTGIANQLKQVAQIIQARNALALHRQIFFVSLGGFDTHGGQLVTQDALLAQLSPALNAFYLSTVEMGVDSQVTTFLESDFARTFQPNTNGGTDHAWGNHYFVIGGAVKGGDMYGKFPIQALGVSDDAGSNGRWIPTTSLDQYGATLAAWFGVSSSAMSTVFPTLANFSTQNIGFI